MIHPLLVPRGNGGLVLRAGLLTAVILAFFGVATGALPVRCMVTGACGAEAANAPAVAANTPATPATASSSVATSSSEALSAEVPQQPVAMAGVAPDAPAPTLTSNDVIAASFALLPEALTRLPTPPKPLTPMTTPPGKTATASTDSGLATRSVRAVSVRPDGTPDIPSPVAEAYASQPTGTTPEAVAAAEAAVSEPDAGASAAPSSEPPPPPKATKAAAAPKAAEPAPGEPAPKATVVAAGNSAKITGGGVNVRSAAKSGSSVLFTLAGGTAITVGENDHGWLHITDKGGRRGWVYKDFVTGD